MAPAAPTAAATSPTALEIYVPCGLAGPYGDLADAFTAAHPEITIKRKLENELPLCHRIRDGENPDIFISLGTLELQPLFDQGRIDKDTMVTLALAPLALIAPPGNPKGITSLDDLTRGGIKYVAVAETKEISAGHGGQQALEKLGLWGKVESKVVWTPFAAQLLSRTATGKTDAAIVYKSCLGETHEPGTVPKATNVTYVADVPPDAYDPIPVVAVHVTDGPNPEAARSFLEFCQGAEVAQHFVKWWFDPPAEG